MEELKDIDLHTLITASDNQVYKNLLISFFPPTGLMSIPIQSEGVITEGRGWSAAMMRS